MKFFSSLTLILLITLSMSACGAQATPTPIGNALDIQNTIVAAASTMIAETQAAIPTATPTATPTDTPVPTDTPLPSPTSQGTLTPVPNSNSGGGDPCADQVLPGSLQGETIKIRINNATRVTLSVSVYLQQTTPQSVCGYRSYTLDAGQSIVIHDLVEGCYTLWAWNPDPENYFIVTNGTSCLDNSDTWGFDISTRSIKLR